MSLPIYLDYNGTTPHDPEVIAAMRPFLEEVFGNASSSHWYGIAPKRALAEARRQVASLLKCDPKEVIFTSGGTESNNHAITGVAFTNWSKGRHIIASRIEHPAVLEVCRNLEQCGFKVTYVPVNSDGLVSVDEVARSIRNDTILITIMHANNEVGTIQPVAEIAALGRAQGIAVHTDAAQSVGKIRTEVDVLGVDLLSVAGHKIYAPKGIGALYIRGGMEIRKFMFGAGQESGKRPGTENIMEIVGLGKACEVAARDLDTNAARMKKTRDLLHEGLTNKLTDLRLNGHSEKRLPNTLSISFKGLEANRILEEIGLDVAASAGAACHADSIEISHVLEAMNVPLEWAKGILRFTTGKMTTEDEIVRATDVIAAAMKNLRER